MLHAHLNLELSRLALILFVGTGANDASNWVNRSPYPMIHILRQASVTKASMDLPDVPVSLKNKRLLRTMAERGELQAYLSALPGMEKQKDKLAQACALPPEIQNSAEPEETNYLYLDDTAAL